MGQKQNRAAGRAGTSKLANLTWLTELLLNWLPVLSVPTTIIYTQHNSHVCEYTEMQGCVHVQFYGVVVVN
jgi:hypothetical protein